MTKTQTQIFSRKQIRTKHCEDDNSNFFLYKTLPLWDICLALTSNTKIPASLQTTRWPQKDIDDNSQTISRYFISTLLCQSKFNISNSELMNEVCIEWGMFLHKSEKVHV